MSQFPTSTGAAAEIATGLKYALLAGAGAGVVYLIFFNNPTPDDRPVFDKVLDALPKNVKEVVQPVAELQKSGIDFAKEAASKGITTEEGAKSAASAILKATPYGRLSSVLDPHNSTDNRIAQFALNALSVNPVMAAINWALPAPKLVYEHPVEQWCDQQLKDTKLLQTLSAGAPDVTTRKFPSPAEYFVAMRAAEEYNNAIIRISPCLSKSEQWEELKKTTTVFDFNQARSFAYQNDIVSGKMIRPQFGLNARGYISTAVQVYGYDYDKLGLNSLKNKQLAERFKARQQSMLSSDYWTGILD